MNYKKGQLYKSVHNDILFYIEYIHNGFVYIKANVREQAHGYEPYILDKRLMLITEVFCDEL